MNSRMARLLSRRPPGRCISNSKSASSGFLKRWPVSAASSPSSFRIAPLLTCSTGSPTLRMYRSPIGTRCRLTTTRYYSPALIVEVLSPSNPPAKVNRQRIVPMSAGTDEFWVVDPEKRTVLVTDLRSARIYASGDTIPLTILGGGTIAVDDIFAL